MPANYPKVELRTPREIRSKLELFRLEMQAQTGKKLSLSKVVNAILEDFFEADSRSSKRPPVAFGQAGGKK